MRMIEKVWNPPADAERKATRAERRKKHLKTWNPVRAWQSAKQSTAALFDKLRSRNSNGEKLVVAGIKMFDPEERRSFLSKLAVTAAVTAGVASASLVMSSERSLASQLANYIQFTGVGDGSTPDSGALNTTITTANAQPNGGTIFVTAPSVSYVIDRIVLKNNVDIIGAGMFPVQFKAQSGSTNDVFVLDTGHVIGCRYENFSVNGNGNANQNCFMLQATTGSTGDGGLWYSIFKKIFVNGFSGYSWWLRGGTNGANLPHQFITFEDCIGTRPTSNTYSRCILLTGQTGQVKFQGVCDFDGNVPALTGYNIELGAEFFNPAAPAGQQHGGSLVGGTASSGSNTPYNIIFLGVTSQNALTAIYTFNTFNVNVNECYFENVAQVLVGQVCYGFNVRSCHFTNCGVLAGAGFIYRLANGARGTIITCDVVSTVDRFIAHGSGNGGGQAFARGNYINGGETSLSSNVTYPVGGPTADVQFAFQVYILNNTPITSITSLHHVGDRVSFVNFSGGPTTFTAGNNIKLGSKTTLTLPGNFDAAIFELSEIAAGWQLVGTTGTLS